MGFIAAVTMPSSYSK